jgi:hypothetical protein
LSEMTSYDEMDKRMDTRNEIWPYHPDLKILGCNEIECSNKVFDWVCAYLQFSLITTWWQQWDLNPRQYTLTRIQTRISYIILSELYLSIKRTFQFTFSIYTLIGIH